MVNNKCRINNLAARNIRRDASYQMVLIDLANAGAIDKTVAEALLGYTIPSYITLPKSFDALEQLTSSDDNYDNEEDVTEDVTEETEEDD